MAKMKHQSGASRARLTMKSTSLSRLVAARMAVVTMEGIKNLEDAVDAYCTCKIEQHVGN